MGSSDGATMQPYTLNNAAVGQASRNRPGTQFLCGDIAGNTGADSVSSLMVQNAGGGGDTSLAAISYHCQGAYGIKTYLRADGFWGIGGWSSPAWRFYSDSSGNVNASGNITAYSDPRLKENVAVIQDPWRLLDNIEGVTFTWKFNIPHIEVKAGKSDYGILADQVKAVMPEVVSDSIDIDGVSYMTVDYSKIVPVLIEAVKDLKSEILALRAELATLRNEVIG
jgi:hypothetical protein